MESWVAVVVTAVLVVPLAVAVASGIKLQDVFSDLIDSKHLGSSSTASSTQTNTVETTEPVDGRAVKLSKWKKRKALKNKVSTEVLKPSETDTGRDPTPHNQTILEAIDEVCSGDDMSLMTEKVSEEIIDSPKSKPSKVPELDVRSDASVGLSSAYAC